LDDTGDHRQYIAWATEVVSAYVSNNSVPAGELPSLIGTVHASLARLAAKPEEQARTPAAPPVPIKKSITDEYLICLEDGKRFKSLKRHLQTVYGMTPDQYREKWGLSRDYPMVAPAYAKARSALAKEMGLGASRRRAAAAEAAPSTAPEPAEVAEPETEAPAAKPRGRRKKAEA
jgi:predicted transcriptional regulator